MSKIIFENRAAKAMVVNKLSYPEALIDPVYRMISSGMAPGILPIVSHQKGKDVRIECDVQGMIPLDRYFRGIVTKDVFLFVVEQIVRCIRTCEKLQINPNNLDLNSDVIFVEQQTQQVRCVYWPVVNNQRGAPSEYFFKNLPGKLMFDPKDGMAYLQTYKSFFTDFTPFSINGFEKMIMELSGRAYVEPSIAPAEKIAPKTVYVQPVQPVRPAVEFDPFSQQQPIAAIPVEEQPVAPVSAVEKPVAGGVACVFCGGDNSDRAAFCIHCGAKLKEMKPSVVQKPGVDDTVNFGIFGQLPEVDSVDVDEKKSEPLYPTLTRVKTGEVRSVNEPTIRIGTDRNGSDWVITENHYISRNHAMILTCNGEFFVTDMNSKNHTYVNGKMIQADQKMKLEFGDTIRMADEEFKFTLEQ